MATDGAKRLVRQSLIDFMSGRDPHAADEVLHENVVMHPPGSSVPIHGAAAFKEAFGHHRRPRHPRDEPTDAC